MVYRPFHFDYIKSIIETSFADSENRVINHYAASYSFDSVGSKNTVINLPESFLNRSLEIKKIKNELQSLAKKNVDVNVFIPHTLGVLSNYVYYRLAGKYKNIKINIFYEGVIVFYNYDHDYFENLSYYVTRWINSLITNVPYKINKRLLNLRDDRINKIYTPFLNLNAPSNKLVEIKLKQINYVPVENTCVLIGLKLEEKYKENTEIIIESLYNQIDKLGISTVYFKDHPSDKSEEFYAIAKNREKKLTIIDDTSPIENIIENYKPKYILSSWSSALINLSNMLPKTTEIYCVIAKKMLDTDEAKRLINAYIDQHIKVIYI